MFIDPWECPWPPWPCPCPCALPLPCVWESSDAASSESSGVVSFIVRCSLVDDPDGLSSRSSLSLSMLARPARDRDRLMRDGDRERARATSCATCTMDARVAAGCPYRDEYDAERSRDLGRLAGEDEVGLGVVCPSSASE